jgi:hypothetical protein
VTRRIVLIAALVATLLACAFGTWSVGQPAIGPFLIRGATDIVARTTDLGQTELTYRMAGAPYAWYDDLTRSLSARGWRDINPWRPYGTYATYAHVISIGPAFIRDEVDLGGDAHDVQLRLRRTFHIRWSVRGW